MVLRYHEEPCTCYECIGPEYRYDGTYKYIVNNMKFHTLHEPCQWCDRPKTEYRDLGRKGYYECWWCRHRAVGRVV